MMIFIRGMNGGGDNTLRLGPFTYGEMHVHWQEYFRRLGIPFFALERLGTGPTEEVSARALQQLEALQKTIGFKQNSIVLIGHSQGGLVARVLSHSNKVRETIKAIVTVGTPHRGAWLAKTALKAKGLRELFPTDLRWENQKSVMQSLSTHQMEIFNQCYPPISEIRHLSLLTSARPHERSLPFRVLAPFQKKEGDGVVELESQSFGETVGPYRLDHLGQLGYAVGRSAKGAQLVRQEFLRMMHDLANLIGVTTPS